MTGAYTEYTETYTGLYHGTTADKAESIVLSGFNPSDKGWCGFGVYFYDIKAKAWWSANRTCRDNPGSKPAVIEADIIELRRIEILDLRTESDLKEFGTFVDGFLSENNFDIYDVKDEFEKTTIKRAMLLNFYCKEKDKKLVIGYFKQPSQPYIELSSGVAESLQLAIGIETIYCAKDKTIITNIRRR